MMKKGNVLSLQIIKENPPLYDKLLTAWKMKGKFLDVVTHCMTPAPLHFLIISLILIGTHYWISLPPFLFREICLNGFWWTFCRISQRLLE